jgi:ParB family transcriptional regulator, chromosome partitioning protein
MASKNSIEVYGASGKTNLLTFDPEKLRIIEDPKHPLYDERVKLAVDEAMVASIMFRGVIEPVIIWKDPESGETCVVAGRQRVKNAREANRRLKERGELPKDVPAVVTRGEPKALMGVMVMENEGRKDTTPMGRAKLAQRLVEAGYPEDTICVVLHCSKAAMKNYLALLDCTATVRNAVDSGKIPATMAYSMSRLDPEEQRATLDKMIAAGAGETKKHRRAKKMKAAAGKDSIRTKREVLALREQVAIYVKPSTARELVLATLDWFLGGEEPALVQAKSVGALSA